MSEILSQLQLSPELGLDGLVPVCENSCSGISLAEQRILHEVLKISKDIDFVFFRRFLKSDVRTSQPIAYIIDNTSKKLDSTKLARLHHTLWLNGTVPLLYVDNADSVDILSCVSKPAAEKAKDWSYSPFDSIFENTENISEQIKRFSALRLVDGTFWENDRNKNYIDAKRSAHNVLLEKIKQADRKIGSEDNPLGRRLLLLTILIKYLEDRGVFKTESGFFSKYVPGANSFYEVLCKGTVKNIEEFFACLEDRFNGGIFTLTRGQNERLTREMLRRMGDVVRADSDRDGQLYFWDLYNFEHIPIEIISHVYQYFTEKGKGAVFTPVLLVNLMLDQVMALEDLKGTEKVFDPTCGSGIFLVSAFRRLVYVNQWRKGRKLNAQELIELLNNTIYGVELQEEAAYITCFNLALAICDVLQPEIIWNKLKFDNLIEHTIFVGDIGEMGKKALTATKSNGFDIILGNPPFIETLTPAIIKDMEEFRINIPAKQVAYYVLIASAKIYLCENGKLCMVQPYGFLYNSNTASMRCNFFGEFAVSKIFDFISINGLFYDANTKAIAIYLQKKPLMDSDKIVYLTFRRTISISEKICFELDHYDYHYVSQSEATDKEFVWKANLLGGGRLKQLARHLRALPTIHFFIKSNKWYAQVGLKVGRNSKRVKRADWLYNKPLLTSSDAINNHEINKHLLSTVNTNKIREPKTEFAFLSPLVIISQIDSLESTFWNSGFLAYTHEFIGIKTFVNNEKGQLETFFKNFVENILVLQACLLLLGFRTLAGRSTATYKKDIMNLPWPPNGDFDLLPWERELLDDIRDYMGDYVRHGQKSKLLENKAMDKDLMNYSKTFLRLMNKSYPKMKLRKYARDSNLILIAFSFSETDDPLPEIDNFEWTKMAQSAALKKQNSSLQTLRITRILTGNTLIIIKPDNLRYWIRSTAIRDVDDTIADILKGGA
jgi:type I restriction-modification system DNA methylase subunit